MDAYLCTPKQKGGEVLKVLRREKTENIKLLKSFENKFGGCRITRYLRTPK